MRCLYTIAGSVVVLAVGAAAVEAPPAHYANREFGLYFDVPAGWALDTKPSDGLFVLRDTLGLMEINVAACIMPKKKDVRGFADKAEKERGWAGKGRSVADMVKADDLAEKDRATLKELFNDDTKTGDDARKKYEEGKAKRPVTVGTCESPDAIPSEPEFLAKITTRFYDDETADRAYLTYYVIGGGVGYIVAVGAARVDFYAVLPLAKEMIKALALEKLSGGRYALPDAKALATARMGIISGKVLINGAPVGGAPVNLYGSAEDRARGVPTYSSRSNGYGEYTFTNLAPGRYYLLEVYGVSDAGQKVHSVQPITNIDVSGGRVTFINVEVVPH